MRAGLPEPKAFLNRCRAERDTASKAAMADGVCASIHTAHSTKRWGGLEHAGRSMSWLLWMPEGLSLPAAVITLHPNLHTAAPTRHLLPAASRTMRPPWITMR